MLSLKLFLTFNTKEKSNNNNAIINAKIINNYPLNSVTILESTKYNY